MRNTNTLDMRHTHAKKCKADLGECKTCQANIEHFNSLPGQKLSKELEDPLARNFHVSLGSIAIENFIDRTRDHSKGNPKASFKPRVAADIQINTQVFRNLKERGVRF